MGCTSSIKVSERHSDSSPQINHFSTRDNDDNEKEHSEEEQESNKISIEREDTIHNTPMQSNTIIIKCDCNESLLLKWFNKGETISFEVKGKWRPDPTLPECGSKGFLSYIMNNHNYGSLLGRILSSSTFQINDNTTYTVEANGPLLLKMNAPRSNLNSKGELIVKVFGGEDISFKTMNERTGWSMINMNFIMLNCSNINDFELQLLISMNKIRHNPKLFADQFIVSNPLLHKEFLSNDKKQLNLLSINDNIQSALLGINKEFKENNNKYEALIRLVLKKNDINISNCQFGAVKQFKERNSHKILMKLLLIDLFYASIFNESFTSIAIKTLFIQDNKTIVIIIFSK